MEKSTTSNDIIKIICIIVGIVIVIGGIIYILRMKFKRDKEKAKETVEILKTPLDKSDELRDKYLNEEVERLTMGILTRFTDIMKSNINALLDKCEDPAKMIDQTLRDLREDLVEVKKKQPTLLLMQKVQIVKFKNVKMKLLNIQQLLKML